MGGTESVFYSHDHGHYFPGGPAWTIAGLQQEVASSYALPTPPNGLDAGELERLANQLEAVVEQELVTVMSKLPDGWPVQDDELDALIDFLRDRRQPVAQRLRSLAGVVEREHTI
jgi:hypothetical protein